MGLPRDFFEEVDLDQDVPCFMISAVSRFVSLHPQTIRHYERLGLVRPSRSPGNTRLYSRRDVVRLRQITSLKDRGVSLAGIEIICELLQRLETLEQELERLRPRE